MVVLVLGVVLVRATRARLAEICKRTVERHDVYALPQPERVVTMSLGYRAALADLLFAHVLVESGLHLQERRRFETVADYLFAITTLDPKFATPYRFADTLITLQVGQPSLRDYERTRELLRRGLKELPFDTELWLTAGQFMAYLAPGHIEKLAGAQQAEDWRLEGARTLARSCELVGSNEAVPYHCVTAARLLGQAGEREAVIRFVERILAVNDDPAIHAQALRSLSRVVGEEQREQITRRSERVDRLRAEDLPFVGKNRYLSLGPPFDPFLCLDPAQSKKARCATSFIEYHARLDRERSEDPQLLSLPAGN